MQTEFELLNSESKGACLKGKLLLLPCFLLLTHSLYLDCLRSRQSRPGTAFYLRQTRARGQTGQTDTLPCHTSDANVTAHWPKQFGRAALWA